MSSSRIVRTKYLRHEIPLTRTQDHGRLRWCCVPPAWFCLQIARFFRARLYHKCMRSALALLTALVSLISPARAQSPLLNSGLLNLGLAFPTSTSNHIVLAIAGMCAAAHTGACADVEI